MSEGVSAVAYYRMSTDRQEASIPAQQSEVHAYARKHGYRIIREYRDDGISGDVTEKRLGFQQMLKDASGLADFRVVLAWDQDRIGRFNILDAGRWLAPLVDADVRLETVAQGPINWGDFAGRIVWAVQQEAKHAYLVDLSRNVARGRLRKAKMGYTPSGRAPYGYSSMQAEGGKRLVPGGPIEVEVVRWLFRTYAEKDVSLRWLANDLNLRGTPPPRGKKWGMRTIYWILRNPKYVGDMVWSRSTRGKYHSISNGEVAPAAREGRRHKKPQTEWVIVRNAHNPLVDRETFEQVQKKLAARRTRSTPHSGGGTFLLSGLVICGHCGRPMYGNTKTKRLTWTVRSTSDTVQRSYQYRHYVCSGYNMHGLAVCKYHHIDERLLVDVLARRIQETFLSRENLIELRKEIQRQLEARHQVDPRRHEQLREQIALLSKRMEDGFERLSLLPKALVPEFARKVQGWGEERARLQAELSTLLSKPDSPEALQAAVEKAVDQLEHLRQALQDLTNKEPALIRELFRQMVSKIELWFEQRCLKNSFRREVSKGLVHLRPDLTLTQLCNPSHRRRRARYRPESP
jgi:DNA invertase Pin-like site-specific DNA recombinase